MFCNTISEFGYLEGPRFDPCFLNPPFVNHVYVCSLLDPVHVHVCSPCAEYGLHPSANPVSVYSLPDHVSVCSPCESMGSHVSEGISMIFIVVSF